MTNRQGMLAGLTTAIASCDSSIVHLQTNDKDDQNFSIDIELTTRNRVHFAEIMRKIRNLPDFHSISRHSKYKQQE